jgi:hypothetical protein
MAADHLLMALAYLTPWTAQLYLVIQFAKLNTIVKWNYGCLSSGSGDQRQNTMLMILLAQSCTLDHGSARYSALNGPKSDPSFCSQFERKPFWQDLRQPTPLLIWLCREVEPLRA